MNENESEKQLSVFNRLIEHCKTREEFGYLNELAKLILSSKDRRSWLIYVMIEYKYSLPIEGA